MSVKCGNNNGLTIIELLVSISILSIVSIAIFSFMVTSTKVYSREVSQTDLQQEAQLVINQLQDMLIDASVSVVYSVTAGGTEQFVLNDEGISEDTVTQKNIYIYNENEYYQITWEKAGRRLDFSEYEEINPDDWQVKANADHVRMADYVGEFAADLSNLEKSRSIGFRFLFAVNNVSYATQNNITLRNKVIAGIGEGGPPAENTPAQDKITISPKGQTVWPGESILFTHLISSDTGGYPSQEAVWSLEGNISAATTISGDGILNISEEETGSKLEITVTAKYGQKKADGSVVKPFDKAEISVKLVNGIGVVLTEGGSYTGGEEERLIAGSTMQFMVNAITGPHIVSPEDLEKGTITWSLEKGMEYASIDEKGMVSIAAEAPVDTVIQAKAVFSRNSRELAEGRSNEYKVVELKERGVIYVDSSQGEYTAPEGEVWFPEKQTIGMDWSKIPAEWKNEAGTALKSEYFFNWKVTLNGGDEYDHKGIYKRPEGGDTENANLEVGLSDWMQWNEAINYIEVQLIIYKKPDWEKDAVFESNIIRLEIPNAHYLYSYTKDGPYVEDLQMFVTKDTREAHVYYYVYGYAGSQTQKWEEYDSPDGWFKVTNEDKYEPYTNLGWKKLYTDTKNKIINFMPEADSGSSVIRHRIWAEYDDTKLTVNFKKSNVETEGYYVTFPGDTGYKDNGYLYGDCGYVITTEKPIIGGSYYKLVITDKKENKLVTAYYKSGYKQWMKNEP